MAKLDDDLEGAFLREFAERLGLEELSEAALATSLGFDEITDERLDQWFVEMALAGRLTGGDPPQRGARVVQTDPDARSEKPTQRQKRQRALSPAEGG